MYAQLRITECLFHIGYRFHVKKYQFRKQKEKYNRKKIIIERFKYKRTLLFKKEVKQGNNNNVKKIKRIFFKDAVVASSLTDVNKLLLSDFINFYNTC